MSAEKVINQHTVSARFLVSKSQLLHPGADLEGIPLRKARVCAAGSGLWVSLGSEGKWWKTTRFPSGRIPETSN